MCKYCEYYLGNYLLQAKKKCGIILLRLILEYE